MFLGADIPDLHHYVPQFLLRNFRGGTKSQIHVFDKHTGKTFRAGANKLAAEKGFYDVPRAAGRSFEPMLANLESYSAEIIARIVARSSIAELSTDDRGVLSHFFAAQLVRVPHWRNAIGSVNSLLRAKLSSRGIDPEDVGLPELTGDKLQAAGLLWFQDIPEFVPYFRNKDWVLYTTGKQALYLSDNPLTLHNHRDATHRGTLGIGVLGIELYFPLSPELCLGMICPSRREEAEATLTQAMALPTKTGEMANAVARLTDFATATSTMGRIELSEDNVVHLNSLQVQSSARYCYSSVSNFDLIREMLETEPSLRFGLKPTLM